ncbi:hypothetical protein L228DRAFT_256894 [Xylona heveae TC161]|uniref:DUF6604 domain-containing protein n=1 Tax=Xylona heveae (strain CBS 132557 / TC161) TaxID=1328760 RepID=A0A165A3S8_XYLHT|nr:hypothetical protein L228DRAFT_256894 [Xylona heveae TC161]KZF19909.1 hypothetical protein L228DRAFT_256894 [Xylona heveae TC161]
MAEQHSAYLRYKRDQRFLVYWIIQLSSLISLSKLIAKHARGIPATIYRLFQSIIAARKETHELFLQIVADKPDPEIEKSNVSHKYWIDGLTEAFNALGGEKWASVQKNHSGGADEEDEEEVIFANKFSALHLRGQVEGKEDDGEEVEDETGETFGPAEPVRPKKKSTGKGKKGKRGKKSKGKSKQTTAKGPSLDEIPLESYRIIEDEHGLVTDYLMAVYSLVQQWMELRDYLQSIWHQVAYKAIGMVAQTESKIFVDFPGHDSFETVMKTITRGDPDKAKSRFEISLHMLDTFIDVKEQFLVHAYRDLLDFITDFQKTRSGKPTNPMLSEISNWSPTFNLQRATKEQRLKWRRAYTINWLYDLVNVFSSIVIALETVDWSVKGPWNQHRRLFGLNEFAGAITDLAMQKSGTDIRSKILPHHVFQLQCIVDSLTVDHVLVSPPQNFRSRRDVDLFLDRNLERPFHGFCQSVDGGPTGHMEHSPLLTELQEDFINWLGESKYMHGLSTIPPSQFSTTNANGLWEYSPFLCGVGLVEALDLAYSVGVWIWDRIPEPMCAIHLHNMLVQKGYIEQTVGLYGTVDELFKSSFFGANRDNPTSNFSQALLSVTGDARSPRANLHRQALRRHIGRTATDFHGVLDCSANRFFKTKSLLRLYREAEWAPERIPDAEIPMPSSLAILRLAQAKHETDPTTGKKVMQDTELVRRARTVGMDDETMMQAALIVQKLSKERQVSQDFLASLPKEYKTYQTPDLNRSSSTSTKGGQPSGRDLLGLLKFDILNDVSAKLRPLSSLNYLSATLAFMLVFTQAEDKLRELHNPLWIEAYDRNPTMTREKRASFTSLVLAQQDDECMRVLAEAFQSPRTGFMNHIYWLDLDDPDQLAKSSTGNHDDDSPMGPSCTVM